VPTPREAAEACRVWHTGARSEPATRPLREPIAGGVPAIVVEGGMALPRAGQ